MLTKNKKTKSLIATQPISPYIKTCNLDKVLHYVTYIKNIHKDDDEFHTYLRNMRKTTSARHCRDNY